MVYKTKNSDLAAFLLMEGMQLSSIEKAKQETNTVFLCFDDPQGRCPDLEIVFIRSEFKQYIDIRKELVSRVHKALKEL